MVGHQGQQLDFDLGGARRPILVNFAGRARATFVVRGARAGAARPGTCAWPTVGPAVTASVTASVRASVRASAATSVATAIPAAVLAAVIAWVAAFRIKWWNIAVIRRWTGRAMGTDRCARGRIPGRNVIATRAARGGAWG